VSLVLPFFSPMIRPGAQTMRGKRMSPSYIQVLAPRKGREVPVPGSWPPHLSRGGHHGPWTSSGQRLKKGL
jgi:hypothetical protein